jgi:hypothetical protein
MIALSEILDVGGYVGNEPVSSLGVGKIGLT